MFVPQQYDNYQRSARNIRIQSSSHRIRTRTTQRVRLTTSTTTAAIVVIVLSFSFLHSLFVLQPFDVVVAFPNQSNQGSSILFHRTIRRHQLERSNSIPQRRNVVALCSVPNPQQQQQQGEEGSPTATTTTTITTRTMPVTSKESMESNGTSAAAIGAPTNNATSATLTTTTTNETSKNIQRKTWNPFRLAVLRLKMTEPAMTSPLNYGKYNNNDNATFRCAYCDHILFPAAAKYNSGTGWPSFWRTAHNDSVAYHREWDGRLECRCSNCQSHLGHVFMDGPYPSKMMSQFPEWVASIPTSDPKSSSPNACLPRFCINGFALTYHPTKPSPTSTSQ